MRLTLLLILLSLYSCKKEYTCSCDVYAQGQLQTTQTELINDTKSGAKKTCKSKNSKNLFSYGGFSVDVETKCELK